MTKPDIITSIAFKHNLTKKEVNFVIDRFLEEIKASLQNGEPVSIRGFGQFYRVKRKKRTIISPMIKGSVEIPERDVIAFKSSINVVQNKIPTGA